MGFNFEIINYITLPIYLATNQKQRR